MIKAPRQRQRKGILFSGGGTNGGDGTSDGSLNISPEDWPGAAGPDKGTTDRSGMSVGPPGGVGANRDISGGDMAVGAGVIGIAIVVQLALLAGTVAGAVWVAKKVWKA